MVQSNGLHSGRLTSLDVSISLSLSALAVTEGSGNSIIMLGLLCHLPGGLLHWEQRLEDVFSQISYPKKHVSALLEASLVYIDTAGALRVLSPIVHHMLRHHPAHLNDLGLLEKIYAFNSGVWKGQIWARPSWCHIIVGT